MPNFYHQVISQSTTLSSKALPTQIDSLDTLLPKSVHIRILKQLGIGSINGILNPLAILQIISSAKDYSNLVFIGPVGFLYALLLRFIGYKNKISIILYDVSFVELSRIPRIVPRLKSLFIRQVSRAYFSRRSKAQLLVLCSLHYDKLKNYEPSLDVNCFKYGVYTPFYLRQRKLIQESSFSLTNIHPSVQQYRYCIAIGSAYRNDDILKRIAGNSQEKDHVFLKISINHSLPPKSVVQLARNLFALYNYPPQEYLELLFYSSSALVLSARPSSMAGLTTVLECLAMKKQVFVQETCYIDDYMDNSHVKKLPFSTIDDMSFHAPHEIPEYCEFEAKDQYHQYFLGPAKSLLALL